MIENYMYLLNGIKIAAVNANARELADVLHTYRLVICETVLSSNHRYKISIFHPLNVPHRWLNRIWFKKIFKIFKLVSNEDRPPFLRRYQ